mmetsp:Transcript_67797/g.127019  ORF Transcript_67797/g.127019 Transcript_67797/m.127019 type:complete len:243 (-) Transcript_67797:331-1059(-)
MAGLKEEKKKLAERMRVLEASVARSNSILKELEQCVNASKEATASSSVVSVRVSGFDEEISSVLTAVVSPEACSSQPSSEVSSGSPAFFIFEKMTGSIQILGADRMELGSWPLDVVEKSPVETDLVMDGSELGVRKVLKVKITAFKAGQLPELVAQTKREIGSVDDERKAANKKLGEMRQKAKPPPTAAGDTAIVAQKKNEEFHLEEGASWPYPVVPNCVHDLQHPPQGNRLFWYWRRAFDV